MTDQNKIDVFNTLETLKAKISGCFGNQDKIFASHPLDEDRAKELRKLASKYDIRLKDVEDIVAGYLFRSGFFAEHIIEQTKKASKFFSKKLN